MKNLVLLIALIPMMAFAKGKIQNEDVKSLSDIESVLTITGNLSSSTVCIASPSSTTNVSAGMFAYDTTNPTYIASGTTVVGIPGTCSAGQIQLSATSVGTSTGDTITFGGQPSQLINDSKIWVTSVTPAQQLSSAISKGVIGGSQGSKNYLSTYNSNTGNGNFEQAATTGWSLFNTTLTGVLPTGSVTAGASSITTFAATSSSPIAGSYSLNTASSGAITAGQGFISSAFTIDTEDQAKIMTIKAYYAVQSGASNLNFSGTSSNSFAIYVYDVTNAAWIQPAGVYNLVQSSGAGYITGTFQTTSNSTQYRLAIIDINATSGASSIYWDDFSVGPQTAPLADAVGNWVAYTPTLTGFGTASSINFYSRRVGDTLEVTGSFVSGTPTATQAAITLGYNGVNGNVVTDTTKTPNNTVVGVATQGAASSTFFGVYALVTGANNYIGLGTQTSTISATNAANGNAIAGTGSSVQVSFKVPIVGWSSPSVASSDTDTRVIAARITMSASQSIANSTSTTLQLNSVNYDTAGAFNTGTYTYTTPVAGVYRITGTLNFAATTNSGDMRADIYVNGSAIAYSDNGKAGTSSVAQTVPIYVTQNLKAGSTIYINAFQSTGASLNAQGDNVVPGLTSINIERISGPSVITATESVNARYYSSTSTITSSLGTVVYATKDYDSHNAYNNATGVYTVPVSGKYVFSSALANSGTYALNNTVVMQIQKNGTAVTENDTFAFASESNIPTFISDQINCLSGDLIKVQVSNAATTPGIVASNTRNYFTATRVGN